MATMQVTHGIVTDTGIEYYASIDGRMQWIERPINTANLTTIAAYVDVANKYNLTQLWVLPGTRVSDMFEQFDDTFVTSSLEQYRVFPKELTSYLVARCNSRPGQEMSLVVPAYITGLPQSVTHMGDAKALYAYVVYLLAELGIPFVRDAKGTGIALLKHANNTPERNSYIRPLTCTVQPFYEHKQVDLSWSRTLQPEEMGYRYLIAIDRNNMYLAATSGLHVGSGNYQYNNVPTVFNKKQPGLWLVSLSGDSAFSSELLPAVIKNKSWQDTAMVQAAIECGYQVTVHAAYMFPEAHTTFNHWYTALRDALVTYTNTTKYKNTLARTAAIETVKMMYRQTIGLMGHQPDTDNGETFHWYSRPDIFNAVVGESKRRMFLTLTSLVTANIPVVAVYVDAIYFLSNQPIETALPTTIVISDQIGKFKHKGSYPLSDVSHMLTNNPQTLVQGLAKYKREV